MGRFTCPLSPRCLKNRGNRSTWYTPFLTFGHDPLYIHNDSVEVLRLSERMAPLSNDFHAKVSQNHSNVITVLNQILHE